MVAAPCRRDASSVQEEERQMSDVAQTLSVTKRGSLAQSAARESNLVVTEDAVS
jgi:hypothetical protein